jgi:hypothetical protein
MLKIKMFRRKEKTKKNELLHYLPKDLGELEKIVALNLDIPLSCEKPLGMTFELAENNRLSLVYKREVVFEIVNGSYALVLLRTTEYKEYDRDLLPPKTDDSLYLVDKRRGISGRIFLSGSYESDWSKERLTLKDAGWYAEVTYPGHFFDSKHPREDGSARYKQQFSFRTHELEPTSFFEGEN